MRRRFAVCLTLLGMAGCDRQHELQFPSSLEIAAPNVVRGEVFPCKGEGCEDVWKRQTHQFGKGPLVSPGTANVFRILRIQGSYDELYLLEHGSGGGALTRVTTYRRPTPNIPDAVVKPFAPEVIETVSRNLSDLDLKAIEDSLRRSTFFDGPVDQAGACSPSQAKFQWIVAEQLKGDGYRWLREQSCDAGRIQPVIGAMSARLPAIPRAVDASTK